MKLIFFTGFLVDFIPYPVINSFTTSAAITIAVGQIKVSGCGRRGAKPSRWSRIGHSQHLICRYFVPQMFTL